MNLHGRITLKINWKASTPKNKDLYFNDLKVGESFINVSGYGQGAVYRKVVREPTCPGVNEYFMLEIETSKLWNPTKSAVRVVDVEVNIPLERPSIYD
jgi:hypothetical protein